MIYAFKYRKLHWNQNLSPESFVENINIISVIFLQEIKDWFFWNKEFLKYAKYPMVIYVIYDALHF